jgi:hypothetical protein
VEQEELPDELDTSTEHPLLLAMPAVVEQPEELPPEVVTEATVQSPNPSMRTVVKNRAV